MLKLSARVFSWKDGTGVAEASTLGIAGAIPAHLEVTSPVTGRTLIFDYVGKDVDPREDETTAWNYRARLNWAERQGRAVNLKVFND